MTTRDDFLRRICIDPFDDAPRLVYADWLEEQGDTALTDRAEFIRLGCELSAWPHEKCKAGCYPRLHSALCPVERVENRHAWLRASNFGVWTESLPESLITTQCPSCVDKPTCWETGVVECRQCESTGVIADHDRVDFERGFVSSITLPRAEFMEHAATIFTRHPVTSVRMIDCKPRAISVVETFGWWGSTKWKKIIGVSDDIPFDICNFLVNCKINKWITYPTSEAAHAALSRACVDYGRSLVGIPAIVWQEHQIA